MEFVVGTVIGVVGLYGTCLQMMEQVGAARGFTKDSKMLRCMFEAEKLLYEKWGESVGIDKSEHHHCLDKASDEYEVVIKILENLRTIWADSETLLRKYDLKPASVSMQLGTGNVVAIRSQQEPSFRRKLIWASKDKKKFESLLGDAQVFIQKLYDVVSLAGCTITEVDDKLKDLKSFLEGDAKQREGDRKQQQASSINVTTYVNGQRRKELFRWIGGISTERKYEEAKDRHPDTCTWIQSNEKFLAWFGSPCGGSRVLWLHGGPGIGKTFLSASIIEYLRKHPSCHTAFHFCSHDDPNNRQPFSVLRSWIFQLVAQRDQAFEIAWKYKPETGESVPQVLWNIFRKILAVLGSCYLVVDGYDECLGSDRLHQGGDREFFLEKLLSETQSTRANILIVSRNLPFIKSSLDAAKPTGKTHTRTVSDYAIIQNDTAQDIKSVSRTITGSKIKDPTQRDKISDQLATGCQGMFLWLRLEGKRLQKGMRATKVESILNSTPHGLNHAYERNLVEISRMDSGDRNQAQDIFRWMLFAFRPLTVLELLHALEVMQHPDNDNLANIPGIDEDVINVEILEPCGSLVDVRRSSDSKHPTQDWTVHFVHFSAKEFLLNAQEYCENKHLAQLFPPDSGKDHGALHRTCILYLFLSSASTTSDEIAASFADYSTKHWVDHYHKSIGESRTACVTLQRRLFVLGEAFSMWIEKIYKAHFGLHEELWTVPRGCEILPLHVACRYNLDELCAELLEECEKVPDSALLIAAFHGNESIVRLLLDKGPGVVDVNAGFVPALCIASYQGHEATVTQLLKSAYVDVNLDSDGSGAPLYIASQRGHVAVVKLLLKKGDVQVNLPDRPNGDTPLHAATMWGKQAIVRLLLNRKDVHVNAIDRRGFTPLDIALKQGSPEIIERIRHKGGQRGYEVRQGPAVTLQGARTDRAYLRGGRSSTMVHGGRTASSNDVGGRSAIGHGIHRARTFEVGARRSAGMHGVRTPSESTDPPPRPRKPPAGGRHLPLPRAASESTSHWPPPRPASDVSHSHHAVHRRPHSPARHYRGYRSTHTVRFPPPDSRPYRKVPPKYHPPNGGGLPNVSPWFPRGGGGVPPPGSGLPTVSPWFPPGSGGVFLPDNGLPSVSPWFPRAPSSSVVSPPDSGLPNVSPWFPQAPGSSGVFPPDNGILPGVSPWYPLDSSSILPPESLILPKVSPWVPPNSSVVLPPNSVLLPEVSPWVPPDGSGVLPLDSLPAWSLPTDGDVHDPSYAVPPDTSVFARPSPPVTGSTELALVLSSSGPKAPPAARTDDKHMNLSPSSRLDPAAFVFFLVSSFYLIRYMLYVL